MSNTETTISTQSDPQPTAEPTVVVAGGTSNTDPSTVNHEGRLAALETNFGAYQESTNGRLDGVESGLSSLSESVKTGLEGLTSSISELTGKIGAGVAEAASTVKEVVTPSEPPADSTPVSKENWFFRGFGKKAS